MNCDQKLRLGIIGMSPGNGHPYSWSAICNGYNKEVMESCGFPVIPRYLCKKNFPSDFISNATVTHVWTQDHSRSCHISLASNIKNIAIDFRDLIGAVDAVLLARDDSENHLYYAKPFLEAGLPIYIDKPLGLTVNQAKKLLDLQIFPGQLFSCSALRYSTDFFLSPSELLALGKLKIVKGCSPKDWNKYSIHVIEPLLTLFPGLSSDCYDLQRNKSGERISLSGKSQLGFDFEIATLGNCSAPISLSLIGERSSVDLIFRNNFDAFKLALEAFINSSCKRLPSLTPEQMLASIRLVEAGTGGV